MPKEIRHYRMIVVVSTSLSPEAFEHECTTFFNSIGKIERGEISEAIPIGKTNPPKAKCICKGFYQPPNCPVHGHHRDISPIASLPVPKLRNLNA